MKDYKNYYNGTFSDYDETDPNYIIANQKYPTSVDDENISEETTYSSKKIEELVSVFGFKTVFVDELPEVGEHNTIYFVPSTISGTDYYDEYMWSEDDSTWELVGNTRVDMSLYYTKVETDEIVSNINEALEEESRARISGDEELQTALNDEITNRTDADAALNTALEQETEARVSADSALTVALNQESEARVSGDEQLQSALTEEIENRVEADSALTVALNQESEARISGDEQLQSALTEETASRISADSALTIALEQEVSDRESAISTMSSITGSLSAATVGEIGRIDTVLSGKQDSFLCGENMEIKDGYLSALGYTYNRDAQSMSEGYNSSATGWASHAEGEDTTTDKWASHVEGVGTVATNDAEHAEGAYNVSNNGTIHSVGIGYKDSETQEINRKNAVEVLYNGNVYVHGVGGYLGETLENASSLQDVLNSKSNTGHTHVMSDISGLSEEFDNYYTTGETYTKTEVDNLIASIDQFHYEIYAALSAITNPQGNVLYLIGPTGSGEDRYDEYVYSNNEFTKIGETTIDLSGYATVSALTEGLAEKQDILIEGQNIEISANTISAKGYVYNETNNSFKQGVGTEVSNEAEHAEGKWNKSNTNTIHSIGIGASDNRKNAIEVMQDGGTYLCGIGNYDGTNQTGTGVQTLQAYITSLENRITTLETMISNINSISDSDINNLR